MPGKRFIFLDLPFSVFMMSALVNGRQLMENPCKPIVENTYYYIVDLKKKVFGVPCFKAVSYIL